MPGSAQTRLKNQIKSVITNPYNIIVLISLILLVYLIVFPLLDMLSATFTLAARDARGAHRQAGDFTLYYWRRLFVGDLSRKMLVQPLMNSLLIGFSVSVCAIAVGSVLAWLIVRTNLPFKRFFSLAVIIPYMIPSWACADPALHIRVVLRAAHPSDGTGDFRVFVTLFPPGDSTTDRKSVV